jgi:hypothetical protein
VQRIVITQLLQFLETLDPRIAPLVIKLNEEGFITSGSCQGGENHLHELPTVIFEPQADLPKSRQKLKTWLLEQGISGFTIEEVYYYQNKENPEPYSRLRLQFWNQDIFTYFTS